MTQHFMETYLAEPSPFDIAHQTVSGPTGHAKRRGIGTRLAASLVTFWRWHQKARQHQALLELDDHFLADIGITREQAKKEARKPFWI
jgi:uncharacterized protein YjiS (DUF1127 family)